MKLRNHLELEWVYIQETKKLFSSGILFFNIVLLLSSIKISCHCLGLYAHRKSVILTA